VLAAAVVVALAGAVTWKLAPRAARGESATAVARAPDPRRQLPPPQVRRMSAKTASPRRRRHANLGDVCRSRPGSSSTKPSRHCQSAVIPSLVVNQSDGSGHRVRPDLAAVEHDALATTDEDGRFRVDHAPRNVAASSSSSRAACRRVFDLSARHEENQDHRVVLAPAARVHGRVVDTAARPIALAFIEVHPDHVTGLTLVAAAAEGAPTCYRSTPWTGIRRPPRRRPLRDRIG